MLRFNAVVLLFSLLIFGCMPDKLDKWDVDNGTSKGSSTPSGSTLATTSTAQMILADETKAKKGATFDLSHKLHAESSVSGACEIETVGIAGAPVQKLCWLDADELDLFFYGMALNFYVEKEACDYVGYKGYTFFNFQPGRTEVTTAQHVVVIETNGCSMPVDGEGNHYVISAPICYFDRSDIGQPNCDAGTIRYKTARVVKDENDNCPNPATIANGGIDIADKETVVDCSGGSGYYVWNNCLEGPGKDSAEKMFAASTIRADLDGYAHGYIGPFETVWESDGVDKPFDYDKPIDKKFGNSNIYLANYNKFCASSTNTLQYNIAGVIGYSKFQNDIVPTTVATDYIKESGAGPRSDKTNPFYEWTCYDKAWDVKAKIRVVVREWNARFTSDADYLKLANPDWNAVAGDEMMDRTGDEYENAGSWLDATDWDDLANTTSMGVCTGSRPSGTFYISYPNALEVR